MAGPEQLALFDGAASLPGPEETEAGLRRPASPRNEKPAQPPATAPIMRPASLPPGSRWLEVETPWQTIGFVLRTSRRKTVGLRVNDDGLVVTSPSWLPRSQLEEIIRGKAPWILRKLRSLHERQQHLSTADAQWRDGGRFPFLGQYVAIAVRPQAGYVQYSGDPRCPSAQDTLLLPLQADSGPDRIRERVYAWLQLQAVELFDARLAHYCQLAGVRVKSWRIAAPSGRWGSCSSDGRIMLNWRLIHLPAQVVDYVVAHEVAHLRHMHHGPEFWREVARLFPDFAHARQALKPHHPGSLPLL